MAPAGDLVTATDPDALFQQHHQWALGIAYRSGVEDPEAAASWAILKAFQKYDPARSPFRPLLRRILRDRLSQLYRQQIKRRAVHCPLCDGLEVIDDSGLRRVELAEVWEELLLALGSLFPDHQLLIELRYKEGLSFREVAAFYQTRGQRRSVPALKARLRRILRHLHRSLHIRGSGLAKSRQKRKCLSTASRGHACDGRGPDAAPNQCPRL